MASTKSTSEKDDFQFSLLDSFLGYNSANDKTKLDPRFLIRGSKNVYKKISGTIASRPGLKRRGSVDTTSASTKSSFEWTTNLSAKRYLRVANGKLEVESDIVTSGTKVWYELFLTSTITSLATTLTRFVFDTWWDDDDKTDRLIFVRGDSNILYWSGGIAKVLSSTATTITLDTTAGQSTWATAGFAVTLAAEKKIIIEGREATYTGGENTDTLTGVTMSSGDASTITVGTVAIQSVLSGVGGAGQMFPSTFNADFLKVSGNQAVVGSYSSRVIYLSGNIKASSNSNVHGFLDYQNSGSHVYGDPDFFILDNNCKGIGLDKEGNLAIFAGTSDLYIVTMNKNVNVSYTDQDAQARFVYNAIVRKKLPELQAALGHEFIDNYEEYLVWMDQSNQVRALGTFSNSLVQKPAHLSLQVSEELKEDDFTGGHLRSIEDTIYITAPNNGRDWMYQVREIINDQGQSISEKIWQPPQIRGISRFAIMDGVLHGHSNVNPQVYQIWDTNQWTDDHPSEENIPYTCVMRMAYRQLAQASGTTVFDRRQGMLTFDKVYVEGYMPEGVQLNMKILMDYQGSRAIYEKAVSSLNSESGDMAIFFSTTQAPSLGDSGLGDNPLGDGILQESNDQETVPKFRRIVGFMVKNAFEYCIELSSQEPDSRWEILALGPNVTRASQQPTLIR